MTTLRHIFLLLTALLTSVTALGADPTATGYSWTECEGSDLPYPAPRAGVRAYPDSLTPLFISHVGRHGARFLSSSKYTTALTRALDGATAALPAQGKKLRELIASVTAVTAGRWGALDTLGMAEQRGIASRTHQCFPGLFTDRKVRAISSYVPRCIASMDEFTHQLARLDNKIEIYTASGRQNNALLRGWTDSQEYQDYKKSDAWHRVYDGEFDRLVPTGIARRTLGASWQGDDGEDRDFAMNLFKVVSACAAMGVKADPEVWFTKEEYNALWAVGNLEHYLTYSANTLSSAPMETAAALLADIVESLDRVADGKEDYGAELRFGHAETMMPLLALMRLGGCYYMTNYFDTVALHWRDFYVVPMASNIQFVMFRAKSGRLYIRCDFNETPVPLIAGRSGIYTEWTAAREYLLRCLPALGM